MWDNDSPLFDSSVSSLTLSQGFGGEKKVSIMKWQICSQHHCLASSPSQSFLENLSRIQAPAEPRWDDETSRHCSCTNKVRVTLQNRAVAAKGVTETQHHDPLVQELVSSKRPLSPQCKRQESTQAWSIVQKSAEVIISVISTFKCLLKPRKLSAPQEGLKSTYCERKVHSGFWFQ